MTVTGFNTFINKNINEDQTVYSFTFAESNDEYFGSGGGDIAKLGQAWLESYSLADINDSLAKQPIRLKVEIVKTRSNKNYTKVIMLND